MNEYKNWQRFFVALIPLAIFFQKLAKIMFGEKGGDKPTEDYTKMEWFFWWMQVVGSCTVVVLIFILFVLIPF